MLFRSSLEFGELVGLRNPDVIHHLAILQPSASDSLSITRSLPALLGVLEAARRHRVGRVVVAIPAGLLYGEIEAKFQPVKEGRRTEAIGVSHVMAHTMVDVLNVYRERYGIEFCALAMSNVYGVRQRPQDGVVAAFASAVVQGIDAEIFGSGKQTRDFLYIDDAVDGVVRAIDRLVHAPGSVSGHAINLGTGTGTTLLEAATLVAKAAGIEPYFELGTIRVGEISQYVADLAKAHDLLGYVPQFPSSRGIPLAYQWWRQWHYGESPAVT